MMDAMKSTKRLEILEESLKKKQQIFDNRLLNHFNCVKQSNGQPLNDKRNGRSTLDKWDRQNDSLRRLQAEIEKNEECNRTRTRENIFCRSDERDASGRDTHDG